MKRLHGYILKTGARLRPFDDDVGDAFVLGGRLEDAQREALAAACHRVDVIASLAEVRAPEFVLVEDHLFFTRHFVRRAAAAAGRAAAPVRIFLEDGLFAREKHPLGGLHYGAHFAEGRRGAPLPFVVWRGAPFDPARLASLPPCPVAIAERSYVPDNVRLLRDDLRLEYALTREGVLSVRHWSHLLDCNQLALAAFWWDFRPRRVLWLAVRALSALSWNRHRIAARLNVIGRGCDIHPTAFVAGSVLGDGVQVGPHSVIFGSYLGEGARVESLSEVALSVVGAGAVVSFRTKLTASVLYPASLASYPAMQMCVLGRNALHMGGCFPIDMKLTRGDLLDVRVLDEGGGLAPSGKKFLGLCLGHRSILGTGLWVQSGVEVPNDYVIVRDKRDLVTRVPPGCAGRTLSLRDGRLVPLDEPAAAARPVGPPAGTDRAARAEPHGEGS